MQGKLNQEIWELPSVNIYSPTGGPYTDDWSRTSGARYLQTIKLSMQKRHCSETKEKYTTNQRVETQSVNGGRELISRARPKSATLMTSFDTSRFSNVKKVMLKHLMLTQEMDQKNGQRCGTLVATLPTHKSGIVTMKHIYHMT